MTTKSLAVRGAAHSYLRWIQINRRRKGAVLQEPATAEAGTPKYFYLNEMGVRSSLEQRFLARGGKFELPLSAATQGEQT